LNYALARAFDLYSRKEDLSVVRKKIMNLDWSWKRREIEYERLYKKALSKK
jgi:starch synthase